MNKGDWSFGQYVVSPQYYDTPVNVRKSINYKNCWPVFLLFNHSSDVFRQGKNTLKLNTKLAVSSNLPSGDLRPGSKATFWSWLSLSWGHLQPWLLLTPFPVSHSMVPVQQGQCLAPQPCPAQPWLEWAKCLGPTSACPCSWLGCVLGLAGMEVTPS